MSHRSTPERLDAARRSATLNRLIGDGELPDQAAAWMARWEDLADGAGRPRDGAYWEVGWDWIAAQRERPPSRPTQPRGRDRRGAVR
jgi:hypothetical protein